MTPVEPGWQTEWCALIGRLSQPKASEPLVATSPLSGSPVIARDVLRQIAEVLVTLLLAPLLQGAVLQFGERVQRSQGPGIFQSYRDLCKLSHEQTVIPDTASRLCWAAHSW